MRRRASSNYKERPPGGSIRVRPVVLLSTCLISSLIMEKRDSGTAARMTTSTAPSAVKITKPPGSFDTGLFGNLRLYLSQTPLPSLTLDKDAPPIPPLGHKSHTNTLRIRHERHRRLQHTEPLKQAKLGKHIQQCDFSLRSFHDHRVADPSRHV